MGRNLGPLNIKDSYEGLVQISGSQLTDGSGSLIPYLSASVTNADTATSASHANRSDTSISSSHAVNSDTSISSSYATTASFALNVTPPETGSFMITGSVTDDTLTFTKGDATTFDLVVDNVDNANTASLVSTVDGSARSGIHYLPFTDVRTSDGQQLFTDTELQYNPATDTIEANLTGTASYATTSDSASVVSLTAVSTSQNFGIPLVESTDVGGTTGLKLSNQNSLLFNPGANVFTFADDQNVIITGDLNVSGNITGSNASFQTASIGYLRTVTGSATIIGDEFIILNADTPAARYAGLKVYDSGSGTPATASFEWDGLSDNWILVEESGNSGVLLTGPTGSKGSEVLPTVNTIQKGGGHHTLIDSNISDDGSDVVITANVAVMGGFVSASTYYGDGGNLTGIDTDPFPYTGSAEITGSLGVTGSVDFTGDLTGIGKITIGDALNVNSGTDAMLLSIDSNTTGGRSGVFAGYQNTASETDSVVVGGFNNAAGGLRSVIAGGTNNTVTSIYGGAFGGNGNTVSHNNSVILGGSSLSTSKTNEAVVNHLTTNASVVQDVKALSIVANAAELDASTGNMFTLTLQNGVDTELQLSNQSTGQTFQVQITNNAIAAGTISFDSQFLFEGGTAFTATAATSAVDILTFTCFAGGDVVCVSAANFS